MPRLARYSILRLIGVYQSVISLPCVKGGGPRSETEGLLNKKIHRKTIPQPPSASAPFTQGSLWFVQAVYLQTDENGVVVFNLGIRSTAFVDTNANLVKFSLMRK